MYTTNGHSILKNKNSSLCYEVAPRTKWLRRQCSAGLQRVDHGERPLEWQRLKQHEPHFAAPERQKMCTSDPVYEMVEENTREKKKKTVASGKERQKIKINRIKE